MGGGRVDLRRPDRPRRIHRRNPSRRLDRRRGSSTLAADSSSRASTMRTCIWWTEPRRCSASICATRSRQTRWRSACARTPPRSQGPLDSGRLLGPRSLARATRSDAPTDGRRPARPSRAPDAARRTRGRRELAGAGAGARHAATAVARRRRDRSGCLWRAERHPQGQRGGSRLEGRPAAVVRRDARGGQGGARARRIARRHDRSRT